MSIADEITRLQNAKTSIKMAIENKGVTVGNGTIDTYASKINEITVGGGSSITEEEIAYYQLIEESFKARIDETLELTTVKLPNGIKVLSDYCFYSTIWLKQIELPETLEIIDVYSFYGSGIESIEIPVNTTKINNQAFYRCNSLHTVDIKSTALTSIGGYGFRECPSLTKFILRSNTVPSVNANSFNDTPIKNGTGYIYVKDDLVSKYKSATNWSTYAEQIKPISELGE